MSTAVDRNAPCFTVSPDFSARGLPSWFLFNTWLQRALEIPIRIELFDDFASQRQAIAADRVDLIYANPYDASLLIRDKGFRAVAAPADRFDEAIIVVRADSHFESVDDLAPGVRIASTDDPDVHTMCMILLEPADLDAKNVAIRTVDSYVLVAKALVSGSADIGFFLASTFDELSALVKSALRPLVTTRISVLRHALLAGPRLVESIPRLQTALAGMSGDPRGASVLESLGISGWQRLEQEEVEFMIDLMDTLVEPSGANAG